MKFPEYYIENGLKKVAPYFYQYQTFAKSRWIGQTLGQIFAQEFKAKPLNYYEKEICRGNIKVNGNIVDKDYVCKNADVVQSVIHQHERAVCIEAIEIIEETRNLLIVNKPGSLPVHPTARYNYNTLTQILKFEHGFEDLHCVNRLDRLTSGIVMLAKSSQTAAEMMNLLKSKSIKKSYFARVKGHFPYKELLCNEPIAPLVHKAGKVGVTPTGKPCSTKFTFCSFNGRTSLVKCEPLTGRTHQIRVHLQYLGYPIANDPLYGSLEWQSDSDTWIKNELPIAIQSPIDVTSKDSNFVVSCVECANPTRDPIPEQLYIWLHAHEYKSDDWSYKTSIPDWAEDDWEGDLDIEERFWRHQGLWDGLPPKVYL